MSRSPVNTNMGSIWEKFEPQSTPLDSNDLSFNSMNILEYL